MDWNKRSLIGIIILALMSAYGFTRHRYDSSLKVNFEDVALGEHAVTVLDVDKNGHALNFLNFSVTDIELSRLRESKNDIVVSFGNSQSHSINGYISEKDHLFVYYLDQKLINFNVINLSAPNANFQEMYLGLVNAKRIFGSKISTVILSLVFDDLREDGIRETLKPMISMNEEMLKTTETGRLLLSYTEMNEESEVQDDANKLFKNRVEENISDILSSYSEIYNHRGSIRSGIYLDLYFFRNWIMNIKATTKRKIIEITYQKNMRALADIIQFCKDNRTRLVLYIAPIRDDIEIPYIKSEYMRFKKDVKALYPVLDLEKSVPKEYWGYTSGDIVDFMHFRGDGHIFLANDLMKELVK